MLKTLEIIEEYELYNWFLVDAGSEASIFTVDFNNKKYVYKEFKRLIHYENKCNKLNELYNLNLPFDIVHPKYIVKDSGYLMEYLDKCIELDELLSLSLDKKIHILSRIKNIIAFLNRNGIIYGDLKGNNILFDGIDPRLVDLDNAITDKYNYDLETFFINQYFSRVGKIDSGLDRYNLNVFTYCFINGISYFRKLEQYIYESITTGNFKRFHDADNIKIIKNLINFGSTYTDDLLIDNLVLRKI